MDGSGSRAGRDRHHGGRHRGEREKVFRSELTPLSFLHRASVMFADKTAVVHGERRWSYKEFDARVNRLASALRSGGLEKGDRVAYLCPNTPALLEAHYGVPAAGGAVVAINVRLSSEEIGYIVRHARARFLFVDAELEPLLKSLDLVDVQIVRVDDSGTEGDAYESFLANGSPDRVPSWLDDEEDVIAIDYTSGTTGTPKGVMYSHRGAYLNALGEAIETGLGYDSVYLWTLPMFHCNGWCFTWAVTAVAGTHVCLRKVDPAMVWELLETERVTHYCGSPTVQSSLVNAPQARRLGRRVTTLVAASPPSPTLLAQMAELDFRILHVYGLTETYGPTTISVPQPGWEELDGDERARLLARQGQAYVISDLVRVVDDDGVEVPRDGATMGEVVMHGNNVAKGYFEQPEATAEAFRGGWFHSGDLGVWHSDGYIELRDRKKDIIISGGENISTIEVEQAIARHPAVLECAVVAVPDEKWGERPKAFVTLKPGATTNEAEIIGFCRQHLAHYKCPAEVEFTNLPKTSTGKVQKFILREKEWVGHDKRIS